MEQHEACYGGHFQGPALGCLGDWPLNLDLWEVVLLLQGQVAQNAPLAYG